MKGLYWCYFYSFTCVLCVHDVKGTWMFSLFLPFCLEKLARLIFGVWQSVSGSEESLFTEYPSNVSQRLRVGCCCLNNTSWKFFCSWYERLYFLPILFVESEIVSEMIFMYHDWITTFTAWGECRGKFLLAIINGCEVKKKAIPR